MLLKKIIVKKTVSGLIFNLSQSLPEEKRISNLKIWNKKFDTNEIFTPEIQSVRKIKLNSFNESDGLAGKFHLNHKLSDIYYRYN